nr:MAG: hypothetical protein DIU57_21060 [Pseudomonadota bacterium]
MPLFHNTLRPSWGRNRAIQCWLTAIQPTELDHSLAHQRRNNSVEPFAFQLIDACDAPRSDRRTGTAIFAEQENRAM